jgi:hypothetical protein
MKTLDVGSSLRRVKSKSPDLHIKRKTRLSQKSEAASHKFYLLTIEKKLQKEFAG